MYECSFIILGATGDLTKRKLIPALYKLIQDHKLSKFALIGVALTDTSAQKMLNEAKKFIPKIDENIWKILQESSYYCQLDFNKDENYDKLKSEIIKIEKEKNLSGNRVFYLATSTQHFATISQNLAKYEIVNKNNTTPWSRIVYEKPFGYDLKSAQEINSQILKIFSEEQIFRIDHYLGKELVGNIALLRFTNRVFEPLWNNKHVDSVQIIMSEEIGIEGRGAFYESMGAMRDMIQSHCLQVLALVAMEAPEKLSGKYIRDAKAEVLKKISVDRVVLGQYEGYKEEKGVVQNSKTETFAALKLSVNNDRWSGVPFYIKSGKFLGKKETSVHIRFKMEKCLLATNCPTDSNYLTIRIQPDEGFFLELFAKKPGVYDVIPVKMDFCHSCLFGLNTPEAYETLLIDVLRGDQSVFVRSDEIELSWKIVDGAREVAQDVLTYKTGESGPQKTVLDEGLFWRA